MLAEMADTGVLRNRQSVKEISSDGESLDSDMKKDDVEDHHQKATLSAIPGIGSSDLLVSIIRVRTMRHFFPIFLGHHPKSCEIS